MAKVYLDKRTSWWCMDYQDAQGRRRQVKAGRTRVQAEATLRKTLDEVHDEIMMGNKKITKIKLSEFALGEYSEYLKVNLRTGQKETRRVKFLMNHFDNKFLHEVTQQDIERYKTKRLAYSRPATVNRDIVRLKNLFKLAGQWGYALNNPAKNIRLLPENNRRLRYLNTAEYEKLLFYAPKDLKPVITLAVHTGLRKGELTHLKWTDIDYGKGFITVQDTKNNQPRYVPMNSIVRKTLSIIPKHIFSPYVFVSKYGTAYYGFSDSYQKALKLAGISGVCFHTLRHTFASWLAEKGATLQELQSLLGHKTLNMVLRYAHLSPDNLKNTVEKLAENDVCEKKVATLMQHSRFAETAVI